MCKKMPFSYPNFQKISHTLPPLGRFAPSLCPPPPPPLKIPGYGSECIILKSHHDLCSYRIRRAIDGREPKGWWWGRGGGGGGGGNEMPPFFFASHSPVSQKFNHVVSPPPPHISKWICAPGWRGRCMVHTEFMPLVCRS